MKLKLIAPIILTLLLSSCSKNIIGEWSIQKYKTSTPLNRDVTLSNIGTMSFHENGTGEKNISYSVFGITKEDKTNFNWVINDKLLSIQSEGSELSKTWIIVQDLKNFQKLQSTDGEKEVQALELKRIKE